MRVLVRLSTRLSLTLFFSFSFLTLVLAGEVLTVPAPEGEGVADVYSVTVDDRPVALYRSRDQEKDSGEYYFGTFEFTGKVKIEITAPFSLENATVAPERFGVKTIERTTERVVLEADRPFQISFEPNGRVKPLILFGFAPEENAPDPNDPNVVYFGPGVHQPNVIDLKSGQTLYVAAGAVVYGGVNCANSENVTICGRGILSGGRWERFKGPMGYSVAIVNCRNITVRDVVLTEPWSWTCTFWNSEDVLVDGLRVMASNMINDDAIDLCNVRKATIRNCFLRAQDDSIAVKGMSADRFACEDISVEDCVFWTDRANIFRIGYECSAPTMRNIRAKNIDVLYYSVNFRSTDAYWANAIVWLQPSQEMPMSDCVFENFRIRSDGTGAIVLQAKPMSCNYGAIQNPTPGSLRDCVLRDFSVYGVKKGFYGVLNLEGYSETCGVKNIRLENFNYFGEKIDKDSPCVKIQDFVDGVVIE